MNNLFASQVSPIPSDRVSVAHYTAEEVHARFVALLDSLDFRGELAELDFAWYDFKRKSKAVRELKILTIALWGIALEKSFPDQATDFFISFRQSSVFLNGDARKSDFLQNRLNVYIDLLKCKKDTDFLPIASYLADILALSADDMPRLRLKISLFTRTLYKLVFNKLV